MKLTSRNHLLQSIVIGLTLAVSSAHAVLPTQFSLNGDWSDTQNPNGPWSYNHNDTPIAVHQTFFWGQAGWGYVDFAEASILKGSPPTPGTIDPFGGIIPPLHDWVPGDVMMHAISLPYGGASIFLNTRWTSPADGTIDITGRAWDGMIQGYGDRDVAWALLVDGQVLAQRGSVVGLFRNEANAQFGANLVNSASLTGIPILQGGVVEFRVMTDTYYGQFVGVEETITLTAVPEVGTTPLFLAGLAAMAFRRKFSARFKRLMGFA